MHESDEDDIKSKTQVKKEFHALKDLGLRLTEIPAGLLAKCELPENLFEAISDYKRFPTHGARKRQLQFIGKLMRDVDTAKIETVLNHDKQNVELEKRKFRDIETIRDNLLKGNNDILQSLILDYPALDIQHVRQLIRTAQKEIKLEKPPVANRKLFRYLRTVILEE